MSGESTTKDDNGGGRGTSDGTPGQPPTSLSPGALSPSPRDTEAVTGADGTHTRPPEPPRQPATSEEARRRGRNGARGIHDSMGMLVETDELRRYQAQLDGFRAGGRYEDANKAFKTILKRLGGDRAEKHDVDDNIFDRLARLIGRRQFSQDRSDIEFSLETTAIISKFSRMHPLETATEASHSEMPRRTKSRSHERSGSGPAVVYLSNEEIELLTYLQIVQAELEWRRKEKTSFALHLLSAVMSCTYNMSLRSDASVLAAEILLSPYFEDFLHTISLQNVSESNFADKLMNPEEPASNNQTSRHKDEGGTTATEGGMDGIQTSADSQAQTNVVQQSVRMLSSQQLQDLRVLKDNDKISRSVFGGADNEKTMASFEIIRALLQSLSHFGRCFVKDNSSSVGDEDTTTVTCDQGSLVTPQTDSPDIERMTSAKMSRVKTSTHKRTRSKSHTEKQQNRPLPEDSHRMDQSLRGADMQSSCSKMIHTLLRLCLNSIPYFEIDAENNILVQTSYRCLLHIRAHILFAMLAELAQCQMLAIGHYLASWELVLDASSQRAPSYDSGLSAWKEGVRSYESLLEGTYADIQSDRLEEQEEFRCVLASFVRGIDMVSLLTYRSCKYYEPSVKAELQSLADSTYPYTCKSDGLDNDLSEDCLNNVLSGAIDKFRSSSTINEQSNWVTFGRTASILPPVVFAAQATQSLSRSVCAAVTTSLMRAQVLYLSRGLPMCALHLGLGMLHGENGLNSFPPLNLWRLDGLRGAFSGGFQREDKHNDRSNGYEHVLWGLLPLLARSQIQTVVHLTWLTLNVTPGTSVSDIQSVLPWTAAHNVQDYFCFSETLNYPFGSDKGHFDENSMLLADDTSSRISGSTNKQSAVKFRRDFISDLHLYPIWRWGSNFLIDTFLALSYCRLEGDASNLDICSLNDYLRSTSPMHFSYEAPTNEHPDTLGSKFIQGLVQISAQITFESAMVLVQNSDWNPSFWSAAAVGDLLSPGRDSVTRNELGNLLPKGLHDFRLGACGYESSMFRLERGMLLADEALGLKNDGLRGFNEFFSSRLDGTFLAKHFGKERSKQENIISLGKGKHTTSHAFGIFSLCTRDLPTSFAKYFDPLLPNQLIKLLVAHTCFARGYSPAAQTTFAHDSIASALKEHSDQIDASEHGWYHGFLCQALQLLGVICLNKCGASCSEGYSGGPPRESLLPDAAKFLKKGAGALSASHICWSVRYSSLSFLDNRDGESKENYREDGSAYRLHSVSTLASIALKELAGHQSSLPDDELPEYEEEALPPEFHMNSITLSEDDTRIQEGNEEEVIVEEEREGEEEESRQSGSHESLESGVFAKTIEEILSKGKIRTGYLHDILKRVPTSLMYHIFILCCVNEDYSTMMLVGEELFTQYRQSMPPPEIYTASIVSLCLMAEYRNKNKREMYSRQSLVSSLETAASRLSAGLDHYPRNDLLLWTQSIILQVCSSNCVSLDSLRGHMADEDSTSSKESAEPAFQTHERKYDILSIVSMKRSAEVAHNNACRKMHGRTIHYLGSYQRQLNATELSPENLAKYTTESAESVHPPLETVRAVSLWCNFARSAAASGDRTSAFVALSNAEYLVELWNLHTPSASCNVLVGHLISAMGAIYECASDLLNAQTYYSHLEGLDYQGSLTPILRNIGIGLHRLATCWEERKQQNFSTSRESDSGLDVTRLHMRLDSYKVRLQSLLRKFPWCWQAWILYSASLMQTGEHASGVEASMKALEQLDRDCSLGHGGMLSFPAATHDLNNTRVQDCTDTKESGKDRHSTRSSSHQGSEQKPNHRASERVDSDEDQQQQQQHGAVPPWDIASIGWSQVRGIHLASMLPLTLHRPPSQSSTTTTNTPGGGTVAAEGDVGDGDGDTSPSYY